MGRGSHSVSNRGASMIRILGLLLCVFLSSCSQKTDELVLYSARKEHFIQPIIQAFTKDTGIEVVVLTDKSGALIQRLKIEGKNSPADILVTVDAGNLWYAASQDLFKPVLSAKLNMSIPSHLKDPNNLWFGFSKRARTIVYNPKKVALKELSTYEDLATEKWKGKLVLRTSKKVYNQSLIAMLLQANGPEKTEQVVKGWVNNLEAPVYASDTKAIEAVDKGVGDVSIVNTYYVARYLIKHPQANIAVFWPNQETTGVHVNISGAGLLKYAKHPKQAKQFLEWLITPKAQQLFADLNYEFPVIPSIEPTTIVKNWGAFKESSEAIYLAGVRQKEAIQLADKAGYQ